MYKERKYGEGPRRIGRKTKGPRRRNMTAAAQKEIVQLIKLRGSSIKKICKPILFCGQILAGYIGFLSVVKDNCPFGIMRPDILDCGSGSQLADSFSIGIGLGADVQGVGGFVYRSCVTCCSGVRNCVCRRWFCHKLRRRSGCCGGILRIFAWFKQSDNKKQENDTENRNQKL